MQRRRIAIIGAGITGLVAARELARGGYAPVVYERWPDVGGMASAFDLGGGVWIDRYYHHLFASDRYMTDLHEELLPGELEWHRSSVGMFARGRIWPFTAPADLLRYGALPLHDRVRLGAATLLLSRRTDWERMDGIPAMEWLRRMCGERALAAVWSPLLLGKFGSEAERVPLAWLWSKLVLRRKLEGNDMREERLGYPRSSFQAIARALARDVVARGGEIHLDRAVVRVEGRLDGYVLRCAAPGAYRMPHGAAGPEPGREAAADAVLLTTPTFVTRGITEWPEPEATALAQWTYRAAVVLLLELRRPFSRIYWTNVADPRVPFLGAIEHTNLVPAERYPARYLYVSNYVDPGGPLASATTDELLRRYLPALSLMHPGFSEREIMRAWSFREPAAQPVPRIGNRARIMPFATSRPGLFIANTTQIYPEDRGTNYSVRLGLDVARVIEDKLAPVRAPEDRVPATVPLAVLRRAEGDAADDVLEHGHADART